jgi:hypothetical protein
MFKSFFMARSGQGTPAFAAPAHPCFFGRPKKFGTIYNIKNWTPRTISTCTGQPPQMGSGTNPNFNYCVGLRQKT